MEKITMDNINRGWLNFIVFIIVIVLLVLGGNYLISHKDVLKKSEDTSIKYNKKDDSKEFVYYDNYETISDVIGLYYKDIHINLNTEAALKTQNELNTKMAAIKGQIKYISKQDLNPDTELLYTDDDIYSAQVINYSVDESDNYLTITVDSYLYSAVDGTDDESLSFYTFNKVTGDLLSNKDILEQNKLSNEDVIKRVNEYAVKNNVSYEEIINQDYQLTINKKGQVVINFVVKMDNINYNDSIEIN